MLHKLYFNLIGKDVIALPGQLDSSYDYTTFQWDLPPTISFKEEKCAFLAYVDFEKKAILSIIEEFPASKFISTTLKNEIKKYNIQILEKTQRIEKDYLIPKPEELYLSDLKWDFLITSFKIGKYPLLIGPKGCGKTATAYELAKATERIFYPINCGAIFKPKQTLVGSIQAKEGSTYLVDSEFMTHYTSDKPTLIFLDELSRLPQGATNYLMTILDRLQSYIYIEELGKRVYKGKDVVFIAAANFGYEYTDTRNQDGAWLDRFIKFMIGYLPEELEIELISKRAKKASPLAVKTLVKNANKCRDQIDKLRVGVSTRQLIDMAHYLEEGFTLHHIIDEIFVNLFFNGTMDERDTVREMIKATL